MSDVTERFSDIAIEALAASTITDTMEDGDIRVVNTPPEVVDAYEEAATAVSALLAASEAGEERIAHWNDQQAAGLVPKSGAENMRRETIKEAKALAKQAERQFVQSYEKVEQSILKSGLPKLDSDARESLARQELDVALGDARGGEAASRLLGLASSGSAEVKAVLNTPYARTALIARGVSNVDGKLTAVRKTVVHSATTPEAEAAKFSLEKLSALNASYTAASRAFHYSLGLDDTPVIGG